MDDSYIDWQYEVANGDTVLGLHEWVSINRPKTPESPYKPTAYSRPLG